MAFLGRLVWFKGLDVVRDVAKLLNGTLNNESSEASTHNKLNRPVRFVFIGDGPAAASLKKDMPGAIFLGMQPKEEVGRYLASCDVLLFPSTTETYGQAVLESMACGTPAIVSDQGGPAELVREANGGRIVQAGDVAGFTQALKELTSDQNKPSSAYSKAREAGMQYAQAHDWDTINGAVIDLYRKLAY